MISTVLVEKAKMEDCCEWMLLWCWSFRVFLGWKCCPASCPSLSLSLLPLILSLPTLYMSPFLRESELNTSVYFSFISVDL